MQEDFIMKLCLVISLGLLFVGFTSVWHAQQAYGQANAGWVTLFDGKNLDNWTPIGDANGKAENGVLVSKNSYTDFQIRAEFWVDPDANSGIFIRATDPAKVTAANAYEVNIFDKRVDLRYGTGAIVNVAKPSTFLKAANQWNTYDITAKCPQFTFILNGTKTVDGAQDTKNPSGRIALQYGAGVVKFRQVGIRPL